MTRRVSDYETPAMTTRREQYNNIDATTGKPYRGVQFQPLLPLYLYADQEANRYVPGQRSAVAVSYAQEVECIILTDAGGSGDVAVQFVADSPDLDALDVRAGEVRIVSSFYLTRG